MEDTYQITPTEKFILDSLNRNARVLKSLATKRIWNVVEGCFLNAMEIEKNIELKERDAFGYIIGLRDSNVLDYTEADVWIDSISAATLLSDDDLPQEFEGLDLLVNYREWKGEVDDWMKHCFGSGEEAIYEIEAN